MAEFDAIVVGSGISGGWVAKELCERGLKVLVLERGREITKDDYTDHLNPWDKKHFDRISQHEMEKHYPEQSQSYAFKESTKHFWVKEDEHPYEVAEDSKFSWRRGYHLGGRSLMWGRASYRLSEFDLTANARDGIGADWPIRYADLAPWYDHVEKFAGIAGDRDGVDVLPDGQHFLPSFEMTCAELALKKALAATYPDRQLIMGRVANLRRITDEQKALGRGQCQVRNRCQHGCSYGAYFSSISATLPAAKRTGNMTLVTHAIVQNLEYDANIGKVTGVRVMDAETKTPTIYRAKLVFLNASAIASAMILLNSKSDTMPRGLANGSDQVGRNIMDHVGGTRVAATVPGMLDKYYWGNRPIGAYLPRYRNYPEQREEYKRGFAFQVYSNRGGMWPDKPGIGTAFKDSQRTPGAWHIMLDTFGEVLPNPDNRVRLHPTRKDQWGSPVPILETSMGANEFKILKAAQKDAREMLTRAGFENIYDAQTPEKHMSKLGGRIHEMGTARMGRDPKTSVLNKWNQSHEVDNLFITDGAAMTSSACQNPSLTYMALSARAANHAADLVENGVL